MRGKRRRSTWGSIEQLPSGRWRVRWWESTPQGWRRKSETLDGSRKDAERRLAQIRVASGDAQRVPTVGEAWQQWTWPLIERERANTKANNDALWRNHVAPRWADVPLDQVEPIAVQAWLDGLRKVAAAQGLAMLRRIVRRAVAMGAIPASRIDIEFAMPDEVNSHSRLVWSADELARICDAARGECFEAAVILAAFGGCRRGEALGVKVGEVIPGVGGTACVQICRSIGGKGEVGPTKTGGSVRTVVIPAPWAARLLAIQDDARARGDAWLCDDGFGGPTGGNVLKAHWDAICQKAGVERAPFRNLRPSYETMMHWDAGIETSQVQKLMGHSSPTMTHKVYDRPDDDRLASVVAQAFAG